MHCAEASLVAIGTVLALPLSDYTTLPTIPNET
jgi:hypothetical protein